VFLGYDKAEGGTWGEREEGEEGREKEEEEGG